MSSVKTYIVGWEDADGNYRTDYIQALNPSQALSFLNLNKDEVTEIAVVLKHWKEKC